MPGCYVIHLDTERREVGDAELERLEEAVAARELGEVDAVMKAGGLEIVLWVMVPAETEALAERQVRPGLEGLLEELGLAPIASLEWVEDSEDEEDDEEDPGADDEFDDLGDDLDEDDAGEPEDPAEGEDEP
ncbi:MAG TPA: hypothetical protein PK668_15045 [Myxococcota bacterium]|nr:hypothetical protein [Myxococcota bacterium]HRY94210.1 hypothetical protein [Myxococcota bacterium]HSA20104.1 hypothetical protein [Myxococcota bacterium]